MYKNYLKEDRSVINVEFMCIVSCERIAGESRWICNIIAAATGKPGSRKVKCHNLRFKYNTHMCLYFGLSPFWLEILECVLL